MRIGQSLSESPGHKILLLEAGPKDDSFWVNIPVAFPRLLNNNAYNWMFSTESESGTMNRVLPIPRGKMLGGSSSLNGMVFVRGNPLDYDHWSQLGNRGWSYESVLPYFKKMEHFEPGGYDSRGRGGPLNVANMVERHELLDTMIDAAIAEGFQRNPDYNSGQQDGFGYYQVTQKNGQRHSTARAFLDPIRKRSNLHVQTNAQVTGLTFEGKRCVGVHYNHGGETRIAKSAREVVLAAGSVQSPQLLELSGIGSAAVLTAHGIDVRHDLPGVGENYRDHYTARMSWRVKLPITLNETTRGLRLAIEAAKYFTRKRGALTFAPGMVFGFARRRPELAQPDIQFHFMHLSFSSAATRALDSQPGMTLSVYQCRPESTGSIHIRSGSPLDKPVIRPNFLFAPEDRQTLVAGLRLGRKIVGNPAFDRYRSEELVPARTPQLTRDFWNSSDTTVKRRTIRSEHAGWGTTRWPWSTTSCGYGASAICGWPMPPSCRP